MATTFTALNISHMNMKQLRQAAIEVNVNPVTIYTTINQNKADASNGKNALITAIKAK